MGSNMVQVMMIMRIANPTAGMVPVAGQFKITTHTITNIPRRGRAGLMWIPALVVNMMMVKEAIRVVRHHHAGMIMIIIITTIVTPFPKVFKMVPKMATVVIVWAIAMAWI